MFDYEESTPQKALTKPARALGEKLAKQYCTTPPVDVEKIIIEVFGLHLVKLELPVNVSGNADLDSQEIYINTKKHPVHQRFTMAHELGHLALNHKVRKWTEYADVNESSPDKPLEEEANAFASGLLMPGYLLKEKIKTMKPKEMAQLFQVSEEALWYSLRTNRII
ncbi:ImmA/IrrE family metallo-endopeptidase [Sulfoacidibacillus ferrooxidans]|uniref:IrrE N-terminal-like domain-containing protein n=1 Tax=Sulfoacidibacillus ferrooxidans TaxID=2005001 RepID=A0A9X1VBS1_9BACL|nr:hypothetical protein [Sulfoacidibacillus ferrooxidans]